MEYNIFFFCIRGGFLFAVFLKINKMIIKYIT